MSLGDEEKGLAGRILFHSSAVAGDGISTHGSQLYCAVYDGRQKRQTYVLIFVMYDVFAAGEGRLERCWGQWDYAMSHLLQLCGRLANIFCLGPYQVVWSHYFFSHPLTDARRTNLLIAISVVQRRTADLFGWPMNAARRNVWVEPRGWVRAADKEEGDPRRRWPAYARSRRRAPLQHKVDNRRRRASSLTSTHRSWPLAKPQLADGKAGSLPYVNSPKSDPLWQCFMRWLDSWAAMIKLSVPLEGWFGHAHAGPFS